MDIEQETVKLKVWLFVIVLFFISMFYSCEEMKYLTQSKQTEATIDGYYEQRSRRGGIQHRMKYHYENAAGEKWNSSVAIGSDFVPPPGGKFAVEYFDETSRPVGTRNWVSLIFFFGCLAALLIGGGLFVRHCRQVTRKPTVRR